MDPPFAEDPTQSHEVQRILVCFLGNVLSGSCTTREVKKFYPKHSIKATGVATKGTADISPILLRPLPSSSRSGGDFWVMSASIIVVKSLKPHADSRYSNLVSKQNFKLLIDEKVGAPGCTDPEPPMSIST